MKEIMSGRPERWVRQDALATFKALALLPYGMTVEWVKPAGHFYHRGETVMHIGSQISLGKMESDDEDGRIDNWIACNVDLIWQLFLEERNGGSA